jgi:beta-galactosidase
MSRRVYSLCQNWLFSKSFHPSHMEKDCPEHAFTPVILPHTNQLLPINAFDDKDFQFVSSYRRHLHLPQSLKGQKIFVDFDGAMAAAKVYLNGTLLCEHKGGYTPFSVDLTDHIEWDGDNVLAVELDSTERADIPPFGGQIDYLTFGGIYREVRLRAVNPVFIENVFVKPRNVLSQEASLEVECWIINSPGKPGEATLQVSVKKQEAQVLSGKQAISIPSAGSTSTCVAIPGCSTLDLWSPEHPNLYDIEVSLSVNGQPVDAYKTRFGFRECKFTPEGFTLNGKRIQLRGLNRHQTYPWVGGAMPGRVQRRDADILRKEFKVNIVRTSHYPQSTHFLDRCDELGLLVFEEIPGWQHIGDQSWQDLACKNVEDMVRRDWNHPSIILWGVRINESADNDALYTRTNRIAHALDDTRQTGGVRYLFESHRLEDVFTYNDFDPEVLKTPIHPLHLVTEFCGHMYSTKHFDNTERLTEHTRRHAHIQSLAASTPGIAGAIGWCAFDYNTHYDFGSGDRICYHGVADMFRLPKFAASVYRAQCSPTEEVILDPAFHWSRGDVPRGGVPRQAIINSNCDQIKFFLGDTPAGELLPCKDLFPGLEHPPFVAGKDLEDLWNQNWKPLRIEGYIQGRKVIEKTLSDQGIDADFEIHADENELVGDGSDATRVWFRVVDESGNFRHLAYGAICFEISGPGEIVGDNPFALIGGCGAIWIRTKVGKGRIQLSATHPWLGTKTRTIEVTSEVRDLI